MKESGKKKSRKYHLRKKKRLFIKDFKHFQGPWCILEINTTSIRYLDTYLHPTPVREPCNGDAS